MQQKIQEITGAVKYKEAIKIDEINSAEKLSKDAEIYMKFGNIDDACRTFKKLADEHPSDYRGWWGLAKIRIDNRSSNIQYSRMEIIKNIHRAIIVAQGSKREELKQLLQAYAETSVKNDNRISEINRQEITCLSASDMEIEKLSEKLKNSKNSEKGTIIIGFIFLLPFIINLFSPNMLLLFTIFLAFFGIVTLLVGITIRIENIKENQSKLKSAWKAKGSITPYYRQLKSQTIQENDEFTVEVNKILKM